MWLTVTDGVVFVEGECSGAKDIGPISVRIHGVFSQAQLKSLDDVKRKMASKAKRVGANGIIRFRYGQRANAWTWLLGIDDVSWYGEGTAVTLPQSVYDKAASK
jgi:uncharacterized protein YbjQ (UPF0145 family)